MKKYILCAWMLFLTACSTCTEEPTAPANALAEPVVCKANGWACAPTDTTKAIHQKSMDLLESLLAQLDVETDLQTLQQRVLDRDDVEYCELSPEKTALVFRLKGGLNYQLFKRVELEPEPELPSLKPFALSGQSATYTSANRMKKKALVAAPGFFGVDGKHVLEHYDRINTLAASAHDYVTVDRYVSTEIAPTLSKETVLKSLKGFENWRDYHFVNLLAHGRQYPAPNGGYFSTFEATLLGGSVEVYDAQSVNERYCTWEILQWIKDKPGVGCSTGKYYLDRGTYYAQETIGSLVVSTDYFYAHHSAPLNNQHVTFMSCETGRFGPPLPLGENASTNGFLGSIALQGLDPIYRLDTMMWKWGLDAEVAKQYLELFAKDVIDWCKLFGVGVRAGVNVRVDICMKLFVSGTTRAFKERVEVYQPNATQPVSLQEDHKLRVDDAGDGHEVAVRLRVTGINLEDEMTKKVVSCHVPDMTKLNVKASFGDGAPTIKEVLVEPDVTRVDAGTFYVNARLILDSTVERPKKTRLTLSVTEPVDSSCRNQTSEVHYDVLLVPTAQCGQWSADVGSSVWMGNHAYIEDTGVTYTLHMEDVSVYTEDQYETQGTQWTVYFPDGFKTSTPVQVVGTDGVRTWTSASEDSVRFTGRIDEKGRVVGSMMGLLNEAQGTVLNERQLTLSVKTLPKGVDDFSAGCL